MSDVGTSILLTRTISRLTLVAMMLGQFANEASDSLTAAKFFLTKSFARRSHRRARLEYAVLRIAYRILQCFP